MKKFLLGLAGVASVAYLTGFRTPAEAAGIVNSFSTFQAAPPPPSGPIDQAMNSLWNGQVGFQVVVSTQIKTIQTDGQGYINGEDTGTQIVAINGTWYFFNRELDWMTRPSQCLMLSRVVVRSSQDHGQHWSNEVIVAAPDLSRNECAIMDSRVFWDAQTQTWHLMSQMLATSGVWYMNHYSWPDADPMHTFNGDGYNPVVHSGQLFSQICSGQNKHCPPDTNSEGTPEISYKSNGYYYVTFHGIHNAGGSPPRILGYRGIAKTTDFHTWITNASDLPNDALWSPTDCAGWHVPWDQGGCIGGGSGSTLITPGGYTYQLIESADKSLMCTQGQHWVGGLARSSTGFVPSGRWQEFASNPLETTDTTNPCSTQYMDLFVDGNDVYMTYWKMDPSWSKTWFHIAELVAPETLQPFVLDAGQQVNVGDLFLIMQTNTDLVLYSRTTGLPLWKSGTAQGENSCEPHTGCFAEFQGDGNFVIYKGGHAIWASGTWNCGTTMQFSSTSWPYMTVEGNATCPITNGYPL